MPETKTPASVVIVGVGVGLGTALARRFSRAGHPVALVARTLDVIGPLARDLGGKSYVADAADAAAMAGLFDAVERDLGPIGCAICNMSLRLQGPFLELGAAEVERAIRVNAMSAFLTAQEAARRMVPRGQGTIMFSAGRSSIMGLPLSAGYTLAKGGIRLMAHTLHTELGPKGIHVAHVMIGGSIDNPHTRRSQPELIATGALMPPDDIAELYYQTHLQSRSAWSLEVECRPWIEPA